MKIKKWLTYTLGTLLALVILAAVAIVSYRIGATQNISFARPAFTQNFNGAPPFMQRNFTGQTRPQGPQGNFQNNVGPQKMQGNFRGNGWTNMHGNPQGWRFDYREYNRHEGRMHFFSPFFGLIHLVIFGLVVALLGWLAYTLIKKSGLRLVRVQEAPPAPAPLTNETSNIVVDKKRKLK